MFAEVSALEVAARAGADFAPSVEIIDFGVCAGSGRFATQLQHSLEGDLRQSTTASSSVLLQQVLKSGVSLHGANHLSGHSFWISMECCRYSLKQWRTTFDADAGSVGLLFKVGVDYISSRLALTYSIQFNPHYVDDEDRRSMRTS